MTSCSKTTASSRSDGLRAAHHRHARTTRPDRCASALEGSPVLFSGDTPLFPAGPEQPATPAGRLRRQSSGAIDERLFSTLPGDTIVLPGHGDDTHHRCRIAPPPGVDRPGAGSGPWPSPTTAARPTRPAATPPSCPRRRCGTATSPPTRGVEAPEVAPRPSATTIGGGRGGVQAGGSGAGCSGGPVRPPTPTPGYLAIDAGDLARQFKPSACFADGSGEGAGPSGERHDRFRDLERGPPRQLGTLSAPLGLWRLDRSPGQWMPGRLPRAPDLAANPVTENTVALYLEPRPGCPASGIRSTREALDLVRQGPGEARPCPGGPRGSRRSRVRSISSGEAGRPGLRRAGGRIAHHHRQGRCGRVR